MPETKVRNEKGQPFFHRKIARGRATRYMTMNKILPNDWEFVRVRLLKTEDKVRVLEITKLA